MKRRLVINESDRESILNLHEQEKVGRVRAAVNAFRNPTQSPTQQPTPQQSAQEPVAQTQQPTPQQPTPQQPTPQQPTPQQAVTERFTTAKCPGKDTKPGRNCDEKVLKLQVKINDKCPTDKLPVKLKEDGIIGTNTRNALTACDSFIRVTPTQSPVNNGAAPVINTPNSNAPSNELAMIDSTNP
jgi:FtsZ-interacting cell division protein ZipA